MPYLPTKQRATKKTINCFLLHKTRASLTLCKQNNTRCSTKLIQKNNHMKNKGFTLIELLVVLVIITLLASLVGPQLFHKLGSSKVKVAATQLELLGSALDTYRLDTNHYPSTEQGLLALINKPENEKNWDGPYLAEEAPLDPWENKYHYKRPGKSTPYALYTLGQDTAEGGEHEAKDQGKF